MTDYSRFGRARNISLQAHSSLFDRNVRATPTVVKRFTAPPATAHARRLALTTCARPRPGTSMSQAVVTEPKEPGVRVRQAAAR